MSRIQFTGIALSLMLAVFDVGAQQANPGPQPPDFSKVDIKVDDLGHRTFMLEGSTLVRSGAKIAASARIMTIVRPIWKDR